MMRWERVRSTWKDARKQIRARSGVLILAVCSMIAKVMGAFYRVPLTNLLGAQGIGRYQLVFPVFACLLALTGGAIPVVQSRTIAQYRACGDLQGMVIAQRGAMRAMMIAGGAGTFALLVLAYPLARIQGDTGLVAGYFAIAPAIWFVALTGAYKGWFLGHSDLRPSAIVQLIEQAIKLAAGWTLSRLLVPYGLYYGVAGALVAVTFSEAVAWIVCRIWLMRAMQGLPRVSMTRMQRNAAVKSTFSAMLPVTAGGMLFPIVAFADSILLVRLLTWGSVAHADAVAQYGLFTGPVQSLVQLPVVLCMSVALAVVPAVGGLVATNRYVSVKQRTMRACVAGWGLAVPCAIGLGLLARPVLDMLYPSVPADQRAVAAAWLQFSAPVIVLLSQLEIVNAVLQGMGKARVVAQNIAVGGVLKIAVEAVSVPFFGMAGAVAANLAFYGVALLLGWSTYREMVGKNDFIPQNIGKILCASAIMGLTVYAVIRLQWSAIALVSAAIVAGVAAYGATLIALHRPAEQSLPLARHTHKRLQETV